MIVMSMCVFFAHSFTRTIQFPPNSRICGKCPIPVTFSSSSSLPRAGVPAPSGLENLWGVRTKGGARGEVVSGLTLEFQQLPEKGRFED